MGERTDPVDEATARRQHWMGVLAKADAGELAACVEARGPLPAFTWLRRPEPGSVMVKARAGGNGEAFHLGEMTVTRCAVRLEGGQVGHAYVRGRDCTHAEHAAVLDAMLQDDSRYPELRDCVIAPLEAAQAARRRERSRRSAATRVDFLTMVRGENAK